MISGLAKPTSYGKQLNPVIDDIFTPRGRELIEAANDRCPISELLTFFEMSITSTKFQKLGPGIFQEPTFVDILSHNTMGVVKSETPQLPPSSTMASKMKSSRTPMSKPSLIPGVKRALLYISSHMKMPDTFLWNSSHCQMSSTSLMPLSRIKLTPMRARVVPS